ncbi:MAG: tetratricopeptide repeat protein [Thermoguttaceae bacterium]
MSRDPGPFGYGALLGLAVGCVLGFAGLNMYCSMIMELQDNGEEVKWPIPRGLGNQGNLLRIMLDYEAKKTENDKAIDKAIADYTESIRIDFEAGMAHAGAAKWPDLRAAWAYFGRAIAYDKQGDPDRAIADYSEAIEIAPQSVQAYRCRAIDYAKKGETDKAIADLSEAIRLDPRDARMYINRGIISCGKRDYDKAIADFSEAIRLDPKSADAHYNRRVAYAKKGESDNAGKDFDRAKMLGHKAQ